MDRGNIEIMQAVRAGETALNSLYEVQKILKSASNWGIIDLLGGGFLTDIMKHSKIERARSILEKAKHDLIIFQEEINDVEGLPDIDIEIDDLLSFADFFFDNIISDFMVQQRINEARNNINAMIQAVQQVLASLKSA